VFIPQDSLERIGADTFSISSKLYTQQLYSYQKKFLGLKENGIASIVMAIHPIGHPLSLLQCFISPDGY
jgi:hypothetical protein